LRPASTSRSDPHRPLRPAPISALICFDPIGRQRPFGRNPLTLTASKSSALRAVIDPWVGSPVTGPCG
jgi:hypothetical protein